MQLQPNNKKLKCFSILLICCIRPENLNQSLGSKWTKPSSHIFESRYKFDAFTNVIPAITRFGGISELPFVVLTCLFLELHSAFTEIWHTLSCRIKKGFDCTNTIYERPLFTSIVFFLSVRFNGFWFVKLLFICLTFLV